MEPWESKNYLYKPYKTMSSYIGYAKVEINGRKGIHIMIQTESG